MAALDADFVKAGGLVGGTAGVVVGEDTAGELVEAVAFRLGAEGPEQLAAESLSAGVGVRIDGVFADALVDAPV